MKRKFVLLQILSISLLICSCVQAQQSDDSTVNHVVNENKIKQSLPIKFQRAKPTSYSMGDRYFSFPIQFSSENIPIQVRFSPSTSQTWINNAVYSKRKGAPYKCSESKSCQGQEIIDFSWNNRYIPSGETLVKEQFTFGGLTLPNLGVFMTDHFAEQEKDEKQSDSAMLALGFKRAHPKVPTIYESLQTEGLIDEPIVSISLKDNYEGELIFGGYPVNKTKADFQFAAFNGYSVPIDGIGYNDVLEGRGAVIDFESTKISIPRWSFTKINDIINDRGLEIPYPPPKGLPWVHPDGDSPVKCKAMNVLKDLEVKFEGFTLRIPASAYIIRTKGWVDYNNDEGESSEEGCFLALLPEDATDHRIILGQPFLKIYDVVLDSETYSIGFSRRESIADLEFSQERNFVPYIIITTGLAGLVLFGFFLSGARKSFTKPYVEFSGEGRRLDGSPSPSSDDLPPGQVQVSEPIKILPYQEGVHNYVNVRSDE